MHKTSAVAAIAVVALLLAGCQSPPQDEAQKQGCEQIESGAASEAVRVSGGESTGPAVRFSDPLHPRRTERTVVEAGNGRMAEPGALVTFAYAAYNGSTGDMIDAVGYESPYAQANVDDSSLIPGLQKTLLCANAGSRIASVVPAVDAFGDDGRQYGIAKDDSVVFVVDVVAVAADRADGEPLPVMDSLPQVNVGATGEPQVVIPAKPAPAAFSATVLKQGDGEVVTSGATVTVEYLGVVWASNRTFDSSWRRDKLVQLPTTSFVKGFGDALIGKAVGSQVMAILPPELAYGSDGSTQFGIDSTDTVVFVIDILAAVQPPAAAATEE